MLAYMRKWVKRFVLVAFIAVICLFGICLIPSKVDGLYRGEPLCDCLCDSKHYIKIENGNLTAYSPGHKVVYTVGKLVEEPDGTFVLYSKSYKQGEQVKPLFVIRKSLIGGLYAYIDGRDAGEGEINCFMMRALPFGDGPRAVDTLEVIHQK